MTACAKCGYDPDAAVAASWTFHVDRDPPSLNQRLFNSGPRAHLYRKERDVWCWEIRAARLRDRSTIVSRTAAPIAGKRRVTLTRIYAGRQKIRDVDNLAGGMKACVDALVLERIIADDSPERVELHYLQQRGTPTGLRVQIEVLA